MKKISKKTIKLTAGIVAIVLIILTVFIANAFVGNPISKAIAENKTSKYIAETYPDMDLDIGDISYRYRDNAYVSYNKSKTSVDTYFSVKSSMTGKIVADSYENDVLSKQNTQQRISNDYSKMVRDIFDDDTSPFHNNNDQFYPFIEIIFPEESATFNNQTYGINAEDLEIDKIYDVKELAKTAGYLTCSIEEDTVSVERFAEILLELKEFCDDAELPFYAIGFTFSEPKIRNVGENGFQDYESLIIDDFLYSDIYEDGLEERLEIAVKELEEYYAEQDAKPKDY